MSQGCPGIWNLPILHSQIEKKKKNALLFGYQNLFSAHVLIGETAVNSGCKESQFQSLPFGQAVARGFIKVFNRRATEFDTGAKNWQGPEGLDP